MSRPWAWPASSPQQVFAAIVGINREGIGVVLSGPAEQLADDPAIQKAYLGDSRRG